MFLLKLLMKVLLLPIMLVLFVLRVLVKIGIELSSIIIGGLMLIVFGCIIYAIVQQMWSSAFILIAMETCISRRSATIKSSVFPCFCPCKDNAAE